jgi:hypothetical protein
MNGCDKIRKVSIGRKSERVEWIYAGVGNMAYGNKNGMGWEWEVRELNQLCCMAFADPLVLGQWSM